VKAWKVTALGEPRDALSFQTVDDPVPGPGQVAVRVLAAAANFSDVLMCRGLYQVKPTLPFTPGVELCGEVAALGAGVRDLTIGDRVLGTSTTGAFGEESLMDASSAFPAPPTLDDAEAAAFCIGYQTGWFGLHRRAGIREGDVLVVHAAAGGVGSAAVQLGKAAGATVVAVVGGNAKAAAARRLGADVVVDRLEQDFVAVVKDLTAGRGADVIYDPVGGETYRRSTKCIAFEGRIVVIGFAGGEIQSAPLNHPLVKNYSVVGLHWGLYQHQAPGLVRECHQALTELVADGTAVPTVGERIGVADVPVGLQRLADGLTTGRVVMVA
jgi:NADPH2:quinone reductase